MDTFFSFFGRIPSEVIGFSVSTLIFLITVYLVARRSASAPIAFLFLLFSIISGLIISYHDRFFSCFEKAKTEEASPTAYLEVLPNQSSPFPVPDEPPSEDAFSLEIST